jgi:hypothetical protein
MSLPLAVKSTDLPRFTTRYATRVSCPPFGVRRLSSSTAALAFEIARPDDRRGTPDGRSRRRDRVDVGRDRTLHPSADDAFNRGATACGTVIVRRQQPPQAGSGQVPQLGTRRLIKPAQNGPHALGLTVRPIGTRAKLTCVGRRKPRAAETPPASSWPRWQGEDPMGPAGRP